MKDVAFTIFISLWIGTTLGFALGSWVTADDWRQQAVKRGFATYTVDAEGEVTWAWKEQPK